MKGGRPCKIESPPCGRSGITQEELGLAVGVTRQTIISLENGRYNASLLLAHKLARYFDTTIESLFIFDEEDASC